MNKIKARQPHIRIRSVDFEDIVCRNTKKKSSVCVCVCLRDRGEAVERRKHHSLQKEISHRPHRSLVPLPRPVRVLPIIPHTCGYSSLIESRGGQNHPRVRPSLTSLLCDTMHSSEENKARRCLAGSERIYAPRYGHTNLWWWWVCSGVPHGQ